MHEASHDHISRPSQRVNKVLDEVVSHLDDLACLVAFLSHALGEMQLANVTDIEQRGMAVAAHEIEKHIRRAGERLTPLIYEQNDPSVGTETSRAAPLDLTEPAPQAGKRRRVA